MREAPSKTARHFVTVAVCCLGMHGLHCRAQETNALVDPVSRYARSCSMHLALPADWTLKVEQTEHHCRISAQRPADDSRCGVYDEGDENGDGKKTFCDEEKRIVVDVQPGSIRQLATLPGIDDPQKFFENESDPKWGDFVYQHGTWFMDSTMGNYRGVDANGRGGTHIEEMLETLAIRSGARKVLYAERPWRKHFEEGSYCCTATNWEALVDLPGSRFAWIEIQWPENAKNVEQFLRRIR